jgi:hypothetical protein
MPPSPPVPAPRVHCAVRSGLWRLLPPFFSRSRDQISLLAKTKILHQRDMRRADIAAAAALDTVEEVILLRLAEVSAPARTSTTRTVAAHADRLRHRRRNECTASRADSARTASANAAMTQLVALTTGAVQVRDLEAHHRPTHQVFVQCRLSAGRARPGRVAAYQAVLPNCVARRRLPASVTMREITGSP